MIFGICELCKKKPAEVWKADFPLKLCPECSLSNNYDVSEERLWAYDKYLERKK